MWRGCSYSANERKGDSQRLIDILELTDGRNGGHSVSVAELQVAKDDVILGVDNN
jgi:hypothetical protein